MPMTTPVDPQLVAAFEAANGFSFDGHVVLLALVGSRSQNTALDADDAVTPPDVDLIGVVLPPAHYLLGLRPWDGWRYQAGDLDVTFYSLAKTVGMLLAGNPNIVPILWLRHEDYLVRGAAADALIATRDAFSSRRVANAFSGFAVGQLRRMTRLDAGALARFEALMSAIASAVPLDRVLATAPAHLAQNAVQWGVSVEDLAEYRALHTAYFAGDMGEKRKQIVRLFGYDVKNASHTIRTLRMVLEFLQTGHMQVFRTDDAAELRAIKQGHWALETVQDQCAALLTAVQDAEARSLLPVAPNTAVVEALLVSLHRAAL